jgi:multisubunit Na+/H+ antiporter MnhF subunit
MWMVACLVLLVGAVAPLTVVCARGGGTDRLAGLQQLGMVCALVVLLLAQAVGRSDYLIVPLTLIVVSFAGSLVYARLLVPRK